MEQPQSVKILEVCRVAPPPDKPDSVPNSLPLNFFDLIWLRSAPAKRLFFYEISSSSASNNKDFLFDSIIPKLKHSLSLTLHHFRPLTGNLTWPQDSHKPIFNYGDGDGDGDGGVSLTIAESNHMDLYHQSSNDFHGATECYSLIPNLEVSHERASVMALQITLFANSGFCIGITTHHALLDGRTSTSFVKSWAHICKASGAESSSLPSELTPSYDRTLIKDPLGIEAFLLSNLLKQQDGVSDNKSLMVSESKVGPGSVRGTFDLSREKLDKLRNSLKIESSENPPLRISTFSLTCGYLWVCLLKSVEATKGIKKSFFGFAADCRSRLEPPVPPTYFGNCIGGRVVVADAEDLLGEDGVASAAVAISEEIRKLDEELSKRSPRSSSEDAENHGIQIMFSLSGSPRFDVYSVDFGWGKPRKVMMASLSMGETIGISDCKTSKGGVQIELVLPKEEMETFASLFAKGLEASSLKSYNSEG